MSDLNFKTLLVERKGDVEWLTFNRPDSLNALNPDMVDELLDYFAGLYWRRDCRVVVIKGAGKAFCAGLDLKERGSNDRPNATTGGPSEGLVSQRRIAEIVMRMRRCPQPIISLIHGPACGGGFAIALASDIRIAGESARMNCAFIRIGLGGCDIGSSYFLPRLVGVSVASELILTGRFIHAPRALAVGLVSDVVPDADLVKAADVYLADLLTTSPLGLRLTKECLNMSIDAPSMEAAIAMEDRNQILAAQSSDFREGISAFLEKRSPNYKDA